MHTTTDHDALATELLVVRCRLGEPAAYDELVAAWHPRLWRYARRMTGEDDAAEEIVQESWLRILRGLPRLRRPSHLGAWIFGIAHRVLADRLRARYRAAGRTELDLETLDAGAEASFDELVQRSSIERALERLPLFEREVVLLFYLDEQPQTEIAASLGVPLGTVKSRLHRARRLLREALETLGEEPASAGARNQRSPR
ncbi:MAG: sigma-70 family RNA polymerase sigma factor [Acidobacteriota bacterium]